MVLVRTWKESCQLTFFTQVSSLTCKAEWLNLCKYLTHESRVRHWRWSQRLFCLRTCQYLRYQFVTPEALQRAHKTHFLWLCREISGEVTLFCTWEQTRDTSWNPRSRAAHMLGMEEQEPVCTSELPAGLSKGALIKGLARNYFRLPHRLGHGQQWTWIFPASYHRIFPSFSTTFFGTLFHGAENLSSGTFFFFC